MIKLFVMDVDGTMTDGSINIGQEGELFKTFDVKDGYAIKRLHDRGCKTCILTARSSSIVEKRAKELDIDFVIQSVQSKINSLKEISLDNGFSSEEIAYIGDDINDIECIEYAGWSACPKDAVKLVAEKSDYVCEKNGGKGAIREFIDHLISKGEIINIYDI